MAGDDDMGMEPANDHDGPEGKPVRLDEFLQMVIDGNLEQSKALQLLAQRQIEMAGRMNKLATQMLWVTALFVLGAGLSLASQLIYLGVIG